MFTIRETHKRHMQHMHLQYNECTCTFATKTIDQDDDLKQSNDKTNRNVEFGNNICR